MLLLVHSPIYRKVISLAIVALAAAPDFVHVKKGTCSFRKCSKRFLQRTPESQDFPTY